MTDDFWKYTAGGLAFSLFILLMVAVSKTAPEHFDARVVEHEYHSPYTTVAMSGKTPFVTFHPEQFHLRVSIGEVGPVDIQVNEASYHAVHDGEEVHADVGQGCSGAGVYAVRRLR